MMTETAPRPGADERLAPGTPVEIRNRFQGTWSQGFEVLADERDGYRVRRLSDGAELPTRFADDEVRPERRRSNDMWWY